MLVALLSASCADLLRIDRFTFQGDSPGGTGGESDRDEGDVGGKASPAGRPATWFTDAAGAANDSEAEVGKDTGEPEFDCVSDARAALTCRPECEEHPCGGYLWWGGVVPVELSANLSLPQRLLLDQAAQGWATNPVLSFVHCKNDKCSDAGYERWLRVETGPALALSPSVPTGPQTLQLAPSTSSELLMHEVGHVLGLPDAWQRPDRDRYVRLSESAFCSGDAHWDPTTCTLGSAEASEQPYRRTTGLFGPFESGSAMNLAGPEVCELKEPAVDRALPTALDRSAVIELYRTADAWSPFAPLGRPVDDQRPLDYQLATGVTIVGRPALSTRGYPGVEMYARGSDGKLYWATRGMGDDEGGPQWQVLGEGFDSDPHAISWHWNHTDVFARGTDGNVYGIALSDDVTPYTLQWGDWENIGRPDDVGVDSAPTAVRMSDGELSVFVRGTDDLLYRKIYDGTLGKWGRWTPVIEDVYFSGSVAAVGRDHDFIELVGVAAEGGLRWLTLQGPYVYASSLLPGENDIQEGSSPALVYSPGLDHFVHFDLFVQTSAGHLAQRTYQDDWGEWQDLGGMLSSSPTATGTRARPHVDVAAVIEDNGKPGVWLRSWPYERPCYVGASACGECEEACNGACPRFVRLVGNPFFYKRLPYDDVIIARAENGHIYEFDRAPQGWSVVDLSMAAPAAPLAASDPVAYARSDGYYAVVYAGIDGSVVQLSSQAGKTWASEVLTGYAELGPTSGTPHAHVQSDGTNSVLSVNLDFSHLDYGHLYQLSQTDGQWHGSDLSAQTGAPTASGSPLPFRRADGTDAFVYRAGGSLIEMYQAAGDWVINDITSPQSAPSAAGDGTPYITMEGGNAIVYRDNDGNVYELFAPWDSHAFELINLTQEARDFWGSADPTPLALGDPRGYVRGNGWNAVVYRTYAGEICEIRQDPEFGNWVWQVISVEAGDAPDTIFDPLPFVTSSELGVLYVDRDGKLWELFSGPDYWSAILIYDQSTPRTAAAAARTSH